MNPVRIVTTSWDDGHPLDIRVAEMLSGYGLRGTFYVPRDNPERPVMAPETMRSLVALGQEVGAHGLSHCDVVGLNAASLATEVAGSREWVLDATGISPACFCYPRGRFDGPAQVAVKRAGFALGRTTVSLHLDVPANPYRMPVSLQVYPHARATALKHAVRYCDVHGLRVALNVRPWSYWSALEHLLGRMTTHGGVLHLWGHSWEIDDLGWWSVLEETFALTAGLPGVAYLSNGEVARAIARDGRARS